MAVTIWSCTTCGQRAPATRRFCIGCGMPFILSRPGLTPPLQTQFTLPDYLLAAREREGQARRLRGATEGSGTGLIISGAVLAGGALLFSTLSGVGLLLLGAGILAMVTGLWRLRIDVSAMERAGWLVAMSGLVALTSVGYQLASGPTESLTTSIVPTESVVGDGPAAPAARPVPAQLGTWPMFRGDAAHTGAQPGRPVAAHPATVWRTFLGGEIYSSPVVANGRVFVGTKSGFLVALDATDGSEIWRVDLGGYVTRSTPVVADGVVYVASGYAAFALRETDGSERWRTPVRFVGSASPTFADGVLFVPTQEGNIFALDGRTGEEQWHRRTEGLVFGSVAVADGLLAYGDEGGTVYALAEDTGREVWRADVGGGVVGSPAIADGLVYVNSGKPALVALAIADGAERWQAEIGGDASPAVTGDLVVAPGNDQGLYGFDAKNGTLRWLLPTGGKIRSSPALVGDEVYVASGRSIYAVISATGSPAWSFPTGDVISASPAVVDGVLYIGGQDGFLYAIGDDGRSPATSTDSPDESPALAPPEAGRLSVRET